MESSSRVPKESPLSQHPFFHCYSQLELTGDTFFLDPSSSLLSVFAQVLQGTPFPHGLQERSEHLKPHGSPEYRARGLAFPLKAKQGYSESLGKELDK